MSEEGNWYTCEIFQDKNEKDFITVIKRIYLNYVALVRITSYIA